MKPITRYVYFCMRDGTVISRKYTGTKKQLKNHIKTISRNGLSVKSVLTPHYEPAKMRKIVTVTDYNREIKVTKTYIKRKNNKR